MHGNKRWFCIYDKFDEGERDFIIGKCMIYTNKLETVFNRFDANDDDKISADELDSVLRSSFMKQARKSNSIFCFFLLLILSFQYELEPNGGSDIQQDDLPAYLNCTADYSNNGTFVYNSGSRGFGEALLN
ncbi:hypothetical protein JHK85_011322 [Glycine max]|nr:hypothetical protein JHK85_011322 [Glycine max]